MATILDSPILNTVGHRTFKMEHSQVASWYQPKSWPVVILTP